MTGIPLARGETVTVRLEERLSYPSARTGMDGPGAG